MEHPVAIFKGRYEGSFAVLVELKIGGLNGLATLQVGKGMDANFNIVTSVYGKDYDKIVNWINEGKLLFSNKEKTLDFLHYPAPIAETLKNPESVTATKIVTNFENPKIGPENPAPKGEHTRFFRTPQGEVYGFTTGGVIYLDGSRMNARSPMHEYTELWSQIVAAENPAWWRRAKELMATDEGRIGAIWREVNDDPNYNLGEDLRASETLSRATAELFEREQRGISDDKGLFARLRELLREFWSRVKSALAGRWSRRIAQVFRSIRVAQTARTKGAVRVTIPALSPYHCNAVERTTARVAHPIAPRAEGVASARAQSTPL